MPPRATPAAGRAPCPSPRRDVPRARRSCRTPGSSSRISRAFATWRSSSSGSPIGLRNEWIRGCGRSSAESLPDQFLQQGPHPLVLQPPQARNQRPPDLRVGLRPGDLDETVHCRAVAVAEERADRRLLAPPVGRLLVEAAELRRRRPGTLDRKSTRLNSSHGYISYA